MTWNWQRADWPSFTWTRDRLEKAESRFLLSAGRLIGTVRHLHGDEQAALAVEAMSDEAVSTSRIEGESLERDSVQSSIRRELGLGSDGRSVSPAEEGIGELMVDLFRRFADPLDAATLFAWHRMVVRGRSDLRDMGRYRTHAEPMRVVSGRLHDPRVHFEAPPSDRVPAEMAAFIEWFNETAPGGVRALPALTRAGIAHLHFESIHPFEDGNGRIGRAISEKALAQSVGQPTLSALAATILVRRREYYRELESANKRSDVTGWLAWFASVCLEAQIRAGAHVDFVVDKARLLDRLDERLNIRQRVALLRMLREGPPGFKGGLSAGNYMTIIRASRATTTRDLAELVEMEALVRTGERRHTRYHLPFPPRIVPLVTIDAGGAIVETARGA